MTRCYLETPELELETVFQLIASTRMRDIPILNPQLQVAAIGFRRWQPAASDEGDPSTVWAGVLLTPWFMNLLLLPASAHPLPVVAPGGQTIVHLPGGPMPFMAGHEAALGDYRLCSLFSPVQQFADQESARLTAEEILKQVFPPPLAADAPNLARRRLFGLSA